MHEQQRHRAFAVKIGGSVITVRNKPFNIRLETINEIAVARFI